MKLCYSSTSFPKTVHLRIFLPLFLHFRLEMNDLFGNIARPSTPDKDISHLSNQSSKPHSGYHSPSLNLGYLASDELQSVGSGKSEEKNQRQFSGRKLRNRLKCLLNSTKKTWSNRKNDPETGDQPPIGNLFGKCESELSSGSTDYQSIPPLPNYGDDHTKLEQDVEPVYIGTRDGDKSSTKAFPNAVFGNHTVHKRTIRHVPTSVEEPEPRLSQCYQHHHLTLVEKHSNTMRSSSTNQHHHHLHRSHQKSLTEKQISMGGTSNGQPEQQFRVITVVDANTNPDTPMWSRTPALSNAPYNASVCREEQTAGNGNSVRTLSELQPPMTLGSEKTPRMSIGPRTGGTNSLAVAFVDTPRTSSTSGANTHKPNEDPTITGTDSRGHTAQSRFRQFWVENLVAGRSRTKSENQSSAESSSRSESVKERPEDRLSPLSAYNRDQLPPHAHTVTGGSNQAASLLRRLAAYTNVSSPQSDQSSIRSGTYSLRRHGQVQTSRAVHSGSGRSDSVPIPTSYLCPGNEKTRRQKSHRSVIGRLMSMSSGSGKSSEDLFTLPDPSKLPKEEPIGTLEFTRTRLKNPKKISQKFQVKSGIDVLRRKRGVFAFLVLFI
ncbi:hypothetical protein EG68_01027 [Paragonimus skrjabini miyazakii]|uniref:Uncharacterized protein n=1 Tax=Paragonimus skrjabini miyazakii TaxID=59628 RepID=A0A8S9Z2R2_9TREM|nr:hypothetical protein EG68_01027 [Paragonimus skrjabini miyazakii]